MMITMWGGSLNRLPRGAPPGQGCFIAMRTVDTDSERVLPLSPGQLTVTLSRHSRIGSICARRV